MIVIAWRKICVLVICLFHQHKNNYDFIKASVFAHRCWIILEYMWLRANAWWLCKKGAGRGWSFWSVLMFSGHRSPTVAFLPLCASHESLYPAQNVPAAPFRVCVLCVEAERRILSIIDLSCVWFSCRLLVYIEIISCHGTVCPRRSCQFRSETFK